MSSPSAQPPATKAERTSILRRAIGASAMAFYMMAASAVGAVALLFVPETARASIRGTGVPGVDTEVKPLEPSRA